MLPAILTTILLTAAAAAPSDAAEATLQVTVHTMDGRSVAGELVSVDQKKLVIRHEGEPATFDVAQLLSIDLPAAAAAAPAAPAAENAIVRLVDGSQLAARDFSSTPEKAQLQLSESESAQAPTAALAWVRFPSAGAEIAAEWDRILAEPAASSDILIVRKDKTLDFLEGIVQAVKPDVVEFELDGEVLKVKRAKVEGIRFFRQAQETPEPICRLERRSGGALPATKLALVAGHIELTTPVGLELKFPLAEVRRLDFSQGKVVFLSDLDWDPALFERQTYFGGRQPIDAGLDLHPPQRDQAIAGGPLELDRRSYTKGLALHSRTRVVYRLPAPYRRLLGTAGIDDRVGRAGDVRLVIEGDGRELLAVDVRGGEPPKPLDLDITGVKRLSILADFGQDLDIADHLDMVEVRVVK